MVQFFLLDKKAYSGHPLSRYFCQQQLYEVKHLLLEPVDMQGVVNLVFLAILLDAVTSKRTIQTQSHVAFEAHELCYGSLRNLGLFV